MATINPSEEDAQMGMDGPIPVAIPATGRKIPVMTNAEIFDALDREDDEMHDGAWVHRGVPEPGADLCRVIDDVREERIQSLLSAFVANDPG